MKFLYLPLLLLIFGQFSCATKSSETFVYFGTYTKGSSEGIYVSKLNSETGALSKPELAAVIDNPSFIALHPSKEFLFAVVEASGDKAVVCSFAISQDGKLTKINQQAAKGDAPCHVSVDASGQTLLIANYNGSNCASFPIAADGKIGPGNYYKHTGSSADPRRQKAPHLHSINVDPANERVFVADLGIDKIVVYNMDPRRATLTKHSAISLPAGGGPRHFSFHPSAKFAYTNLEMTRQIVAMSYDSEKGILKQQQVLSTLPKGAPATGSTAECLVHPSGKWVYVSNRGHNSIAAFSIDQETGLLTMIEVEPTLGKIPRGFGISPDGQFLIAGHQMSDNITVFKINQETGALENTGNTATVNAAVNVRFLEK
ncbi:MAG: lactonase family protein [Lentisphaeraceae bacterium]|nr:lactonase family protein [Lentisphaeraceae bacterium]